ncbi:MAG: hypothetical protein CL814_09295 [Confluentimicrobium sp.]|uniref:hypothetical protein n=1 Tax=Actibacterium sp. TaxID=1872125 RepID=UPI000C68BDB9|nr:hypothetical protein [Actibacterium sp.]MBC57119.1 hypothetical protein [Actibacterium sp.]
MRKTRVIRDEMHSVEIVELSEASGGEFHEFIMEDSESDQTIWELAASDKKAIAEQFIKDGWPDPGKKVNHMGGQIWSYYENREDYVRGSTISPGFFFIMDRNEYLSDEYLAAKTFLKASSFLLAFKARDLESAVSFCAEYLTNRNLLTTRSAFFKAVERGRKQKRGSQAGGFETSKRTAPVTAHTLSEMKILIDKNPSVSRAAEICANRGVGTSKGANRALWARHNKKS